MTTSDALLSLISERHFELWVHHGDLRCRDPASAVTPEEIESLDRSSAEIISKAIQPVSDSHALTPCGADSQSKLFPLTAQQIFALTYFHNSFYFLLSFRLRGLLNRALLSKSLECVVERHEALRSRVIVRGGIAMQEVCRSSEPLLSLADVTGVPAHQIDDETQCAIEKFVLEWWATGSKAVDFGLVKLDDNDHVLLIALDHVFWDYFSMGLFFRELWMLYGDFLNCRSSPPAGAPLQYGQYAVRQRIASDWFKAHKGYWMTRLAGTDRIRLPADDGLDGMERYSVQNVGFTFDEDLSSGLRVLAKKQQVTLPMVVVSLYAALVARWSGQRDFVIPFILSGREYFDELNAIGYFPHPLLLRVELTGRESFGDLVSRVTREFMIGSEHLDVGTVIDEFSDFLTSGYLQWFPQSPLDIARPAQLDTNKLGPFPCVEWFPVRWKPHNWSQRFDMALTFCDSPRGISGGVGYRADLFTKGTMEWFSGCLKQIAECAVKDPQSSEWLLNS